MGAPARNFVAGKASGTPAAEDRVSVGARVCSDMPDRGAVVARWSSPPCPPRPAWPPGSEGHGHRPRPAVGPSVRPSHPTAGPVTEEDSQRPGRRRPRRLARVRTVSVVVDGVQRPERGLCRRRPLTVTTCAPSAGPARHPSWPRGSDEPLLRCGWRPRSRWGLLDVGQGGAFARSALARTRSARHASLPDERRRRSALPRPEAPPRRDCRPAQRRWGHREHRKR